MTFKKYADDERETCSNDETNYRRPSILASGSLLEVFLRFGEESLFILIDNFQYRLISHNGEKFPAPSLPKRDYPGASGQGWQLDLAMENINNNREKQSRTRY